MALSIKVGTLQRRVCPLLNLVHQESRTTRTDRGTHYEHPRTQWLINTRTCFPRVYSGVSSVSLSVPRLLLTDSHDWQVSLNYLLRDLLCYGGTKTRRTEGTVDHRLPALSCPLPSQQRVEPKITWIYVIFCGMNLCQEGLCYSRIKTWHTGHDTYISDIEKSRKGSYPSPLY